MPTLTPKENYLRLARGEMPEYVPTFTMMTPTADGEMVVKIFNPNIFGENHNGPQGGKDIWGVNYVANEETGYAALPEPNNFILGDIDDWEKVIKAPAMPDVDWEAFAKKDIENSKIDRNRTGVMLSAGYSPFQQLMAFMGFNEGLCALYESPETVKDLTHFMLDFYMPIIEASIDAYKPDIFYLSDDTASKYNPFFSPEIYRDLFKPVYAAMAKPALERGIPIQFHNCGHCEAFVPDMIDFGVTYWDPAQPMNDILALKKQFKGKLVVCGCWDWMPPDTWPEVSEEYVRQGVRDVIDKYAPDGGYAFCGAALGRASETIIGQVNKWVKDEVYNYGRDFYNK